MSKHGFDVRGFSIISKILLSFTNVMLSLFEITENIFEIDIRKPDSFRQKLVGFGIF